MTTSRVTSAIFPAAARRVFTASAFVVASAAAVQAQHRHYNVPSGLEAAEEAKLEADRRVIHREWLRQPANQQAAFAYAILSTRLGDLEGAASTYEAMLMRSPNAGRVRAELGSVYFRLQAMDAAREHFTKLNTDPATPAPVKEKVGTYLAAIEAWQRERQGFSGSLSFGLQSQSNASSVTDQPNITLNGQIWTLQADALGQGDTSAFANAALRYRHPLGNGGHRLLAELNLGLSEYQSLKQLSTRSLEMQLGPDFALTGLGVPQARLSFTARLARVQQGGEAALAARGFGSALRLTLAPGRQLNTEIDWRDDDYRVSSINPRADLWDSRRLRLSVSYSHQITPDWMAFGQITSENRQAEAAMNGYRDVSLRLGVSHRHQPWIGTGTQPWTLGVMASASRRSYKGPDPMINARTAQRSTDRVVQISQTVPFGGALSLQVYGGLRSAHSNYDIRSFSDRFAGLSITRRF